MSVRSGFVSTQRHQSGELSLRPLTPVEDEARGMLSSLVAAEAFREAYVKLKPAEAKVLPSVLCWLRGVF